MPSKAPKAAPIPAIVSAITSSNQRAVPFGLVGAVVLALGFASVVISLLPAHRAAAVRPGALLGRE